MSWPQVKLGGIFEIARGGSPRPIDDYITDAVGGLNWISIKDASNSGKYIFETRLKIRPEGLSKTRMVNPGDFLLTNSMSFGRPYIMKTSGCIHDGWLVLSGDPERVDADYFYHLFGSDLLKQRFSSLAAGAVVKNLNIDLVKGVEVPLPPLPEQKRIAAILDKADAIRRKRQQAIQLADDFLRAVFLDMFGDPITNPKGWDVRPLVELIDPERPVTYGILKPGDDIEGGVPYVRVVDMKDGYVLVDQLCRTTHEIARQYKRSSIREGDLLMSIRGHVGRLVVVPRGLDGANITQDTARLAVNSRCSCLYLYACLGSSGMQVEMQRFVKGAAVKGINLSDVKELRIPVPPIDLQRDFEIKFREMSAVAVSLKESFSCLSSGIKSLGQYAFSSQA